MQYNIIGTDKPTIERLREYTGKIAPYWYDLGTQLLGKKHNYYLKVIKEDHPNDAMSCCRTMFEHWIDVDTKSSWNILINALEKIDQNVLAEDIKHEVLKGKMQLGMAIHS